MSKGRFNQVGEVKGKESENEESFSFQFTPQNDNLRSTRGSLFTLVTIKGKTEGRFDKAKAYYHAFQSSYYAKVNGSIINGLAETLDQLEKDFVHKDDQELEYSLVAAVLWGAVLYLAKSGGSNVWICRGEKLRKLEFNKVASGILEDQDTICLSAEKFSEHVSEEEIASFLAEGKFDDVLEKIDSKVKQVEAAACLVIRLAVGDVEEDKPSESDGIQPVEIATVNDDGEVENPEEVSSEPEEVAAAPLSPLNTNPQQRESKTKFLENLQPLTAKFSVVGKKIWSRISAPWKKSQPGEAVDHVAIRRQRLGQVVVVIVLILILSIGRSLLTGGNKARDPKISQLISSAQSEINEAKNIKSIDPLRAKTLVNNAQNDIAEVKKIDKKNGQIASLETQAAELIAEINRVYKVNLTTVFDYTKVQEGAKINQLALSSDTILASDSSKNAIYKLDSSGTTGSKVSGNFNQPLAVAGYSSGFYIQDQNQIASLNKISGVVNKVGDGSGWGQIVAAATYQTNLYLLDSQKGEVWRYLSNGSSLGASKAYLSSDKPDLTTAVSIAIDDYVWVVTKSGVVYKFAQGKKQDFSISNFTSNFSDVVSLFTNSDSKNLYILDKGAGTLVVLDKTGVYQAAYANSDLRRATAVVVQEVSKLAYVSVDGKIVSLKLR